MAMTAHAALTVLEANGTAARAVPGVPYLDWLKPAVEVAAPACGGWAPARSARANGTAISAWTRAPRVATRTPQPAPCSVKAARDFTEATLRRWGVADLADDVGVVMSELLTNALRHGVPGAPQSSPPPIRLGLLHPGTCVLCAVADPSAQVPVLKEPDYLAESGRGLHVVASLSQQWGWTAPGSCGKVVWATFPLPA
jgi:anti-sigma regulatory factor (Ser/Thr protein kinase)